MAHKHKASTSRTTAFLGPVGPAEDQDPCAHGGVTEHQTCACGATRAINANGCHVEMGEWVEPDEEEAAEPEANTREAALQRQMEKWARYYDGLHGAPENDEDR